MVSSRWEDKDVDLRLPASLTFFGGNSDYGLPGVQGKVGPDINFIASRWRLGAGVRLGVFGVRRVTTNDWDSSLTIGARTQASFDLVRWNSGAVFLAGSFGVEGFPLLLDARLGLGVRFGKARHS